MLSVAGLFSLTAPVLSGRAPSVHAALDTIIEVVPGDRLEITRLQGGLRLVGWDDDERMALEQQGGDPVGLRRQGGVVGLEFADDPEVRLVLRVPRGMRVQIRSRELDLVMEGVDGITEIDLLDGGVRLQGGRGRHQLRVGDGDVELRELLGSVDLLALDGDVRVVGGTADLQIEVTDGDLDLRPNRAGATLRAGTLDGDVALSGPIPDESRVSLSTHDGDITLELDEEQRGRFEVAVWDGSFSTSGIAVRSSGVRPGQPLRFDLGSAAGAPSIQLASFDGDIRIRRPGGAVR